VRGGYLAQSFTRRIRAALRPTYLDGPVCTLDATGLLDAFAAHHPHLLLGWERSVASVALLSALPGETPLSVLRYVMHTPGYTKARAEWRDAVGHYGGNMDVDE